MFTSLLSIKGKGRLFYFILFLQNLELREASKKNRLIVRSLCLAACFACPDLVCCWFFVSIQEKERTRGKQTHAFLRVSGLLYAHFSLLLPCPRHSAPAAPLGWHPCHPTTTWQILFAYSFLFGQPLGEFNYLPNESNTTSNRKDNTRQNQQSCEHAGFGHAESSSERDAATRGCCGSAEVPAWLSPGDKGQLFILITPFLHSTDRMGSEAAFRKTFVSCEKEDCCLMLVLSMFERHSQKTKVKMTHNSVFSFVEDSDILEWG